MNATKRGKPSISVDDIERLLFHLEDAGNLIVKYGSAHGFHSAEYSTATKAQSAIDDLAEAITGTRSYFWEQNATSGGDEGAIKRSIEKRAKRRKLMGVHFPLRALKVV